MRPMRLLSLGLVVCLPAFALADSTVSAVDARALREECSTFPQAGMRDCLATQAENSRIALRRAEEKLANTLSKWDEDDQYVNQAKERFASANKAFAKYRDRQCALSAALSGGGAGNAREIRRLACIAELNNLRAGQLSKAAADLPLK